MSSENAVFRYTICVLNCHVFEADNKMCTIKYNTSYIKLDTEIHFQNAVTFVLVKLDAIL